MAIEKFEWDHPLAKTVIIRNPERKAAAFINLAAHVGYKLEMKPEFAEKVNEEKEEC
ncbi:hypothetical protein JJB75_09590 [Clostridium perfringens]|uniref:hypothetical protein n=1 Tax=Clostridium perfringens TaxID=1502 RepID=UPI000DF0F6C1|nr:hypothetical protein [Clostridium perfringens]EHK2388347.1 hypothetical protein [Clostridium perfringens]MBO3303532.1 hypothetical protein [Clostridium perfringens]MBO3306990.1 hypothetical protein [Clostridium perfringens]MBO3310234.1 hypothetical protein [Clostridium perfringens]MBO3316391.1 hypothetical protein [Clostridium perfringens]